MGSNIGKPASSKDGSEKTELSSNFNQLTDDISHPAENAVADSAEKPMLPTVQNVTNSGPVEPRIMMTLYDYAATLDSQLTVKRGEIVRLLGYSPAGDWSEVEAPVHLPNGAPRVVWACAGGWVRGWVPTSYLTEHTRPTQASGVGVGTAEWRRGDDDEQEEEAIVAAAACPWYHGPVSRQGAEQLLRSGITGSYLVRESESAPGQLSVTVRNLGRVYHYRISRDACRWYFITESHRFPTVVQLIHHHSQSADGLICPLLYPAARHKQLPLLLGCTGSGSRGIDGFGGTGGEGGGAGLDDWEIDRSEIMMRNRLGWGQYGDVYEALWRRYNSIVAVKTLKQDVDLNLTDFLAEASIMKNLQHKNLVRLLGVCTREPPYYIVTEYMPQGNLLNYLRQRSPGELTPPILLYMAVQIASGMAYLEANNFIHRDLAARNCLVGHQHIIKVADFGLARYMQLHEDAYTARNGAKFPIKWTAPEGLAYFRFSSKSDVWAFGVVLWELATYGLSPYPGVELHGVYQLLEKGYRMQRPRNCPESVYSIILRCWSWEAADRPTFAEIKAELEEMWRTTDTSHAIAQELDVQPALVRNSDRFQFTSSANAISGGAGVGTIMSVIPPMVEYPQDDGVKGVSGGGGGDADGGGGGSVPSSLSRSTTCTSSNAAASSSASAVETDGLEGDDEGEEDLRLESTVEKGALHSTPDWNTLMASDNIYQGEYIVSIGGESGGIARVAPASDLPLPTLKTSRNNQFSAPASLPPVHRLQQRQDHHDENNGHGHHHRRYYQQQFQYPEAARRRSGPLLPSKQIDEGSLRCPVRPKDSAITPAESGVGESIVSADSPGGDSNTRQQKEVALVKAPHWSSQKTAVAPAVEISNHYVKSTKNTTSDGFPDNRRMRLDAKAVTQFTTLPAHDRITQYLESLGELGDASERRPQRSKGGARSPRPPLLPHFPPPPPVPPPPQTDQHLHNSEYRSNAVGRSVSCYQAVPSAKLPLPAVTSTAIPSDNSGDLQDCPPSNSTSTSTPNDDVYQAPNLALNDSSGGGGLKAVPMVPLSSEMEHAELTACLNSLSLEATELSATCPQLASELSALSLQLSTCRGQIEARLCSSTNGAGGTAEEGHCLAGIAQALCHIRQALSGMRARVKEKEEVVLVEAQVAAPRPPTSSPTITSVST